MASFRDNSRGNPKSGVKSDQAGFGAVQVADIILSLRSSFDILSLMLVVVFIVVAALYCGDIMAVVVAAGAAALGGWFAGVRAHTAAIVVHFGMAT